MKVGLFIPCYVDALFPEVGIATLELLERLGIDVVYPLGPNMLWPAHGEHWAARRRRGDSSRRGMPCS